MRVQSDLVALLRAETKREAEKIAKAMVLAPESLAALIEDPGQLGYNHRRKHRDHIPEARRMNDFDAIFFGDDEARSKAFRQLDAVFEERKYVNAHLFEGENWAIFYFTQHDVLGAHGKMGPHVHFLSRAMYPDHSCGVIWQAFDDREFKIPTAFHIRYADEGSRSASISLEAASEFVEAVEAAYPGTIRARRGRPR